jgi:hypothetical protein
MTFFINFLSPKPVLTPKAPLSRYQEVMAIKDRLYKDIARLEELQGTHLAGKNVREILFNLGV